MSRIAKAPEANRRRSAARVKSSGGDPQLAFWNEPEPEPAAPKKRQRKPANPEPGQPREVAEKVGQEILGGELNPAEWAAALAASDGISQQAVAEYARRRMERLGEHHARSERKELEMEMRKRHFCGAVPRNVRRTSRRPDPRPSRPGLILIFMGCWGLCAEMLVGMQSTGGPVLLLRSSLAAVAICAALAGLYFSGKFFRCLFAGDRSLGFGSVLCGLSLVFALTMMLPASGKSDPGDTLRGEITRQPILPENEPPRPAEGRRLTLR